jgi:hypothetical protein
MEALFGAAVHAERLGPLAKSWIAIDPVTPAPPAAAPA